ncbi:hypothetical protein PKHYL_11960 [Psychrobacter sp. KH172YL61]|uniref:hypothetical protein n=1 Tax=Psychrobacter sp. KH172YL61 TaxID=2517899 RepID=UPI0010B17FB7|nr:hypothetical protein [Psychrobacter sp. KH172YL61]BBI67005.1 hypothetical protein PKHYL_11960 [Psychrobacter sp. KH172YL61]
MVNQLISAMQTNVYRHAYDYNRWMRLSELFLSLEATDSALEALSRAYRLSLLKMKKSRLLTRRLISLLMKGQLDENIRRVLETVLAKTHSMKALKCSWQWVRREQITLDQAQGWIKRLRDSISAKPGDHTQALSSLDELSANVTMQQQQALRALR